MVLLFDIILQLFELSFTFNNTVAPLHLWKFSELVEEDSEMIKLWIYKQLSDQLAEKEAFFCIAIAKKHQVFVLLDG